MSNDGEEGHTGVPLTTRECLPSDNTGFRKQINSPTSDRCLITDGGQSADGVEQRRIEVVVKNTRRGNLATFADTSAGSGIRSMTDAEIEAHDFVCEIINKIDAEAHESGDLVAEVYVDSGGECSVNWADDAVRLAADGGRDRSRDEVARTDGGTTPQEILDTETEKSNTPGPDADRYDSSTEAARELLTEWVATHVDERQIATAKQIVSESDRDDIHINDVGRTLGCRHVGVTPDGFPDEVELSTWGDANVTSWVFERVDGQRERTDTRADRLFKPELVEEISDAVGGLHDEYYRRTHDNCRRVEVSAEWKRAVTLALVEASATQLERILTGYDEEGYRSFDEYVARLSTPELTNVVERVLKPDEALGTPHGWPRELLIPVHDVLVSGIDPAEVDA